jgi:hypothetical protein
MHDGLATRRRPPRGAADMSGHNCMDHRSRMPGEGDCYVERCLLCGKVRMEQDGARPMAWFKTPDTAWPWRYAYDDPKNAPDGPDVWAGPQSGAETTK